MRASIGFPRPQIGLALVMVLWLVAAMSLFVASVVYLARMDVRQQQFGQNRTQASAFADGAMRLSMRQFVFEVTENGASNQVAQEYIFEDEAFSGRVNIYPASGLIHLGSLTPELLLSVLQYGVGLDEGTIENLSRAFKVGFGAGILGKEELNHLEKFRVLEDLLQVPGISVDTYEVLKDYFYVGEEGAPGINPLAAPRELLVVLAGGNVEVVEEFLVLRDGARESVDNGVVSHAGFLGELISSTDSSIYRVDVTVNSVAQQSFKQRYWLRLAPSREGLPWVMQTKVPIHALGLIKQ